MPLPPVVGPVDPDGANCVACGRCCHHGPMTVHLLESDMERMGPVAVDQVSFEQPKPPFIRFLKNDGERCGCLDASIPGEFPCKIYSVRPEDCRIVDAGSPCCLEARALGRLGKSTGFRRE